MADEEKLIITRVKLPDGQIHYVKDLEAHEILEGLAAVARSGDYEALINKPIIDSEVSDVSVNAVQNKAVKKYIDELIEEFGTVLTYKGIKATEAEVKSQTAGKAGDVWLVSEDGSEFVCKKTFSGAAHPEYWDRLGPIIDISGFVTKDELGELAELDQAEGTFVPKGTVSAPGVDVQLDTTKVNSMKSAGTLPSHGPDVFVAPSFTEGAFSQGSAASWGATVTDDLLEFSFTPNTLPTKEADTFSPGSFKSGAFSAGSLPSYEEKTVASSVREVNVTAPTFTGEEGLVTVSKPYATTFERANIAALRLVSDGYYDNPVYKNQTIPTPAYYFVKYCSGTQVPPKFAALASANDKFLLSMGQNSFIEDYYYKTMNGEFYVAAPIILFEDQKNAELLGINSLTSTNTSMLTVEQATGTEIPTYTVTQVGSKPAQAYIQFDFDGVETGELLITKKVRPLRDGTNEVSYGFDKIPLGFYPFGWTTSAAADSSKYTSGDASYSVAAIDSGKAVTMKLNYVIS